MGAPFFDVRPIQKCGRGRQREPYLARRPPQNVLHFSTQKIKGPGTTMAVPMHQIAPLLLTHVSFQITHISHCILDGDLMRFRHFVCLPGAAFGVTEHSAVIEECGRPDRTIGRDIVGWVNGTIAPLRAEIPVGRKMFGCAGINGVGANIIKNIIFSPSRRSSNQAPTAPVVVSKRQSS